MSIKQRIINRYLAPRYSEATRQAFWSAFVANIVMLVVGIAGTMALAFVFPPLMVFPMLLTFLGAIGMGWICADGNK